MRSAQRPDSKARQADLAGAIEEEADGASSVGMVKKDPVSLAEEGALGVPPAML